MSIFVLLSSMILVYGQFEDLRLHYSFRYGVEDLSQNGNDGVIYGPSNFVEDRFGNADSALEFGGSNYVQTPLNSNQHNMTYSVWVLFLRDYGEQSVIDSDIAYHYGQSLICGYGNGDNKLDIQFHDGAFHSDFAVEINTWYHVVATFQPGLVKLYVDGAFIGEYYHNQNSLDGSDIRIGRHNSRDPQWLYGAISDVKIWYSTLGFNDVEQLYENEVVESVVVPVDVSLRFEGIVDRNEVRIIARVDGVSSPESIVVEMYDRNEVYDIFHPNTTTGICGNTDPNSPLIWNVVECNSYNYGTKYCEIATDVSHIELLLCEFGESEDEGSIYYDKFLSVYVNNQEYHELFWIVFESPKSVNSTDHVLYLTQYTYILPFSVSLTRMTSEEFNTPDASTLHLSGSHSYYKVSLESDDSRTLANSRTILSNDDDDEEKDISEFVEVVEDQLDDSNYGLSIFIQEEWAGKYSVLKVESLVGGKVSNGEQQKKRREGDQDEYSIFHTSSTSINIQKQSGEGNDDDDMLVLEDIIGFSVAIACCIGVVGCLCSFVVFLCLYCVCCCIMIGLCVFFFGVSEVKRRGKVGKVEREKRVEDIMEESDESD